MSRIRTSDGRFVGWQRLPNITISLWQAVVRKLTGHIPRQPWIPFSARAALERRIRPDFHVWEIGAGYSTLWLADRVSSLVSIEASKDWHDRLSEIIRAERITNLDLRFVWRADLMADFSELPDGSLDLLFIDGGPRGLCLERGFAKVRSGGYVYLDNWDTKEFWGNAVDFPERNAALFSECRSFIDFVPAQVGVYEGLLIRKA
jgi:predicted O-methyltransferase YrrM